MRDLIDAMTAAVNLMQDAKPLRQEGRRLSIATLIAEQLIECGHYIHKYTKTNGFGKIHSIVNASQSSLLMAC
jgi:capsule polysaccharide export protein KpsC/LpsZ